MRSRTHDARDTRAGVKASVGPRVRSAPPIRQNQDAADASESTTPRSFHALAQDRVRRCRRGGRLVLSTLVLTAERIAAKRCCRCCARAKDARSSRRCLPAEREKPGGSALLCVNSGRRESPLPQRPLSHFQRSCVFVGSQRLAASSQGLIEWSRRAGPRVAQASP
jgi:hypothetical protein